VGSDLISRKDGFDSHLAHVVLEENSLARETEVQTKMVERRIKHTKFRCDKCGREISPEPEDDDLYNQELLVYLNVEQPFRQAFRRDYCRACLLPTWNLICEAIGADPDDISNSDFEDDL
jgi:hypothetical protein